jgi:hypothetical protein
LEWYILENGLATDNCINDLKYAFPTWSNRCDPAGTKLQKGGESGFEGVLGGSYYISINKVNDGTRGWLGYYWTANATSCRLLDATKTTIDHHPFDKNDLGASLRCIKD